MQDVKTLFERAIIEAFKQTSNKLIIEKLTIAYDEIKFMVKDIQDIQNNEMKLNSNISIEISDNQKSRFILNSNILDKLRRLIERQFFCVKMVIGRIYEKLLDTENFSLLSNDVDLLIQFTNEVLFLIDDLKSTNTATILDKKCISFLNFLKQGGRLNNEQMQVIDELVKSLPNRSSSEAYLKFEFTKEKIISLCKSNLITSKQEGINLLMETFAQMNSIEEQFSILIEKVPSIIKTVIHQPNQEYKDVYFQLGHFLCSMIYNCSFILQTSLPNFKFTEKNLAFNNFFLMKDEILVKPKSINKYNFLNEMKYELTNQKEILIKCEALVKVTLQVIRVLCVYEKIFDLQYVCFILLKRLYFTFPMHRHQFEDDIAMILINLCLFTGEYEIKNSTESKMFIAYLIQFDETSLKLKLEKRIEAKNASIETSTPKSQLQLKEIENEILKMSDFNLRIAFPIIVDVEAGKEEFKYIEIKDAFSLIYIGFATQAYDINFKVLKYIDGSDSENRKAYFKEILTINKIEANESPVKLIMLVSEPCFYKIVWDNSYSWINSKKLRVRTSVLKPKDILDYKKLAPFLLEPEDPIILSTDGIQLNDIIIKKEEEKNNEEILNTIAQSN